MELYTGQLKDEHYNIDTKRSRGKYRKCYDIFTFDVENNNAWVLDDGTVIGYEKGKGVDYWNSLTPIAVVYIWQFSFNEKVYYGRDLVDFLQVLDDMPKDAKCVIWVHNLAHEYMFLQNILTVDTVFARTPHKPMKCTFKEYPNIEFRCSYTMTNLSLENWGKQIGCKKLTGLLDYDKLYTPLSELDENALAYAEQDCVVVYQGIKKEIETYGNVFDVPLTSTGKIRRHVKDIVFQDPSYRHFIRNLVPSYDMYHVLLDCFAGGYCHCNRLHSNRVKEGLSHWDFTSSYPTVLLAEKYAVGKWIETTDKTINGHSDKYSYIYKFKFYGVKSTNPNTYLQISKCTYTGHIVNDNGRIKDCDGTVTITCFDTDYEIIKMLYKFEKVEVLQKWYAYKDYLPAPFLDYILTLYSDKTRLKNVAGQEDFYQQQKGFLNSLYGLCVCKPLMDSVEFNADSHEWHIIQSSKQDMINKLKDLKNPKKAKDTRYFLSFTWGCQCTSYARLNLFRCAINEQTRNGWDCVYFDTDSIFCLGTPNYEWYNNEIDEKLRKCCVARGLDFEKTRPKDIKGKIHPLGHFDREEDIQRFKCIHAKCYIEERYDNKLYMTISGINKGAVELLDDIDDFACGFDFDVDADCVKKLIPTYCYNQPVVTFSDGYVSRYKYGKNLRRTGYKIDITDEYAQLLGLMNTTFDDLEDAQILRICGKA